MRYFEVNQPLSLSKQFKIALGKKSYTFSTIMPLSHKAKSCYICKSWFVRRSLDRMVGDFQFTCPVLHFAEIFAAREPSIK